MYAVMTRDHSEKWSLNSRHRLLERAQEEARKHTSAKYAIRNRTRLCHRDDVRIVRWLRGEPVHLGPASFEF